MDDLHFAAKRGDRKGLQKILNLQRIYHYKVLIKIFRGTNYDVRKIISEFVGDDIVCRKEGIDAEDSHGATALHKACQFGKSLCADILLKLGANVNATNDYGRTALDFAKTNGNWKCENVLNDAINPPFKYLFGMKVRRINDWDGRVSYVPVSQKNIVKGPTTYPYEESDLDMLYARLTAPEYRGKKNRSKRRRTRKQIARIEAGYF